MKLTDDNIATAVEKIQKFFEQAEVSKRDRAKINLLLEEALLRCREHFGEEKIFELKMNKWFGSPEVLIKIRGEKYNPLETPEDYSDEVMTAKVMQDLLRYESAGTTYRYQNGYNEIRTFSTKERRPLKIPGGNVTVAILAAFASAFIVGHLPQFVQDFIVNDLTVPLLETLMHLIVGITIPAIFLSVVSSICIMQDIATFNDIGFKVVRRFIFLMLFLIATSMCACEIFFPVLSTEGSSNVFVGQIIAMLLDAVPDDLFTPFVEGKVLEIVLIAFLVGVCIIILGERANNVKALINDAKILLMKMMELVLKIIPLTIFLSIFKIVMTTSIGEFARVWKVAATIYVTVAIVMAILLIHLKLKYGMGVKEFFRLNKKIFAFSITTVNGSASMMINMDVCKKDLKIDPNLCEFWVPLSHAMFSPGTVVILPICAFVGATMSNATISPAQLLLIAFLAIQLGIVTPKVNGGIIATFTIMLTQMNFTQDAIGPMMVAEVFIINFTSFLGMFVRNCEIYDLSRQVKFSDA